MCEVEKLNRIAPHLTWVNNVCKEINISIIGEIRYIKEDKVFCKPSDSGDLYLKIVSVLDANELMFTRKIIEAGISNLPEVIAYEPALNTFLMWDMGGIDLISLPNMNMKDLFDLFIALSQTQKDSIPYVNSVSFYGYNYTIDEIINELKKFPHDVCSMLSGTQHEVTLDEKKKFMNNTECATKILKSISNIIPYTIHNSDLGTQNVRVVDGKYIFYDWAWGGVSHPFFSASCLLNALKRKLPADIDAKENIVDAYLREWAEYGHHETLKNIFIFIDSLITLNVAFFLKYIRTRPLHFLLREKADISHAEKLTLDERYKSFAFYLKRFIDKDF